MNKPAPEQLKSIPKWVAWKYVKRGGKPTKPPVSPHTGRLASISTPADWGTYDQAVARAQRDGLAGVGFVLTSDDGLTGADLDHVRDAATGNLEPWAAEIVAFGETYTEVSPSGTGLRLFWEGKIDRSIKCDAASVEVYRDGRYLTITGNHVSGTPTEILPAPKTLAALRARAGATTASPPVAEQSSKGSVWRQLNDAALQDLAAWVPDLFGDKAVLNGHGIYRVSSKALGRDLQEDLSISPQGAKDFGVHDMGDAHEGKRSPIDLVMQYGGKDFGAAVEWLRARLGLAPEGRVTVNDFYAYMPGHVYIFTPTREVWPATSVNARLGTVPLLGKDGKPRLDAKGQPEKIPVSVWLDRHRPVEQMTWAPGLPMLIKDRLIAEGGWIEREGVACFNLYRPPTIEPGNAAQADRWLDHVHKVYGDDSDHIVRFLAHRVQRPAEKVNHGLVLGGLQGIGKDTLLEPAKYAVGPWNFSEISPTQMVGRFNGFLKSVILRVSEARDLGEVNRYSFYEHCKPLLAAPPDVLRVDEKNLREHAVLNCCGVVITTNHKTDGIFLPADDRRHFVAWSDLTKEDFVDGYWPALWAWYKDDGIRHVAAYLAELDLSNFDAKAPPKKTQAFWDIVDASRAPEDAEFADVMDALGNPDAITLADIRQKAAGALFEFIEDRKNRRAIPHRLAQCGYEAVRNSDAKDGYWVIKGSRCPVYAKKVLSLGERLAAARKLASEHHAEEQRKAAALAEANKRNSERIAANKLTSEPKRKRAAARKLASGR